MSSCSSRRLLLPKFGLLAAGVILVGACAAAVPQGTAPQGTQAAKTSSAPAAEPPGEAAIAASPAFATLPATASGKKNPTAKGTASTPVASGGSHSAGGSGTTGGSGTGTAAGPTVFGFAAPELESWTASEQVQQLTAMKATGVTSVRIDADWSSGQPTGPDSYDWGPLDQALASIQQAGLTADLIIDGCPSWAAVSSAQGNSYAQPASAAAFANWAAAVAGRYGAKGARYFEIWNEPNNPQFWAPKPDPAAYTTDLKAAYAAIKAVDPSSVVLSGGLAPELDSSTSYAPRTFLQDMYADGAAGSFDGVGYHPYSYPVGPDTDIPESAWSQLASTSPSIRSIMAANGDSAKKVWITEYGAPTSGTPANVSDTDQGQELAQAISQVKQLSWVGCFYVYTWEDVPNSGFGVLTDSGAQKPAYASVVAALNQ